MSTKFKVGDRVRVISVGCLQPKGKKFTVAEINQAGQCRSEVGKMDGVDCSYLELVTPQTATEVMIENQGFKIPNYFWTTSGWQSAITFVSAQDYVNKNYKKPKKQKTLMNKISIMAKKLLDGDTQVLIKAGFIDSELDLTAEGKAEQDTIVFLANKAVLVERAKEVIAEAKENK